jgi:uncharacterized protein (DUF1800 family)
MLCRRPRLATLLAITCLGLTSSAPFASGKKEQQTPVSAQMDEQKRAAHALNRLTFGPRPGDIARVTAVSVDKWIEQQLHPEKIDDSALEGRLASFRTLHMNTRELVENFPSPQLIKAVMDGKKPMPSDPVKRAIYQAQIERMQEKEERKQEAANAIDPGNAMNPDPSVGVKDKLTDEEQARRRENGLYADLRAEQILDLPPDQRMKEILKMSPEEQRALAQSLKGGKVDDLTEGMSPQQKETVMALNNPQQVIVSELMQAKLLRAIYSERQLDEVMADFWFNHFNVFIGKGADRYLVTSYERDVIRPHALGKFEDLLVATAKSPAMMFYLDNWLSVGPNSDVARGIPRNPRAAYRRGPYARFPRQPNPPNQQNKGKRNSGLNENYGRELMELHTLGVNGGYTQKDVTEVARIFTGWTIDRPQQGGEFKFEERMHEPGDKLVLGHRIKSNGEKEGLQVLHLLAHNGATAKFVCTKLAMRFVSDNPPPDLVNRMAQTFLKKDGDIREVLRTLFRSPEFWSADSYRAKVKTPLEFVVSSIRATGADVSDARPLAQQLNNMGMPLYGMQPPTGYSMKSETWVNSSALLGRMNFALALTAGRLKGVQVDPDRVLGPDAPGDPQQVLAVLENSLLAGDVSQQTHATISKQLDDPRIAQRRLDDPARPPNVGMVAGLILGSPEFQRR